MSAVGLVARADDTGLGVQSAEFHRHLSPAKTLIVDLAGRSASGKDLTIHTDRFPGHTTVTSGFPSDIELESWLEGLDVVFTMETPYNYRLYTLARQRGIRTVLQANWELLDYLQDGPHQDHYPDILAMPTSWFLPMARHRFGDQMEVIHLPVPIVESPEPANPEQPFTATRFVHVVGNPALADRNGTTDVLDALRHVTSEVTVTLTCQRPGYLASLIRPGQAPDNVTLIIDSASAASRWSLYAGQHVLLLPRRYGGLCLPVNEALGSGIPVIMPDISPNNDWLPGRWLVPARVRDFIQTKTLIDVHETSPFGLASRIDLLANDDAEYNLALRQVRDVVKCYNWQQLSDHYREVLDC